MDSKSGDLYGHIVAGNSGSNVHYVLAAHDIFEDIKLDNESIVSLPPKPPDPDQRAEPIQERLGLFIEEARDLKQPLEVEDIPTLVYEERGNTEDDAQWKLKNLLSLGL